MGGVAYGDGGGGRCKGGSSSLWWRRWEAAIFGIALRLMISDVRTQAAGRRRGKGCLCLCVCVYFVPCALHATLAGAWPAGLEGEMVCPCADGSRKAVCFEGVGSRGVCLVVADARNGVDGWMDGSVDG